MNDTLCTLLRGMAVGVMAATFVALVVAGVSLL